MFCFCGREQRESRLQEGISKMTGIGGRLPTKFISKWSGPFPFLRMDGERYAFIRKDGKAVRHNVNRLWKHQPWDQWHPDTDKGRTHTRGREKAFCGRERD